METHKKFNSIDDLISYLFDSELLEFEIDRSEERRVG